MKIDYQNIIQIGMLTHDVRKASAAFAKRFGIPENPVFMCDSYEITGCTYLGKPCYGRIEQVCYDLGNTQVEFIEPVGDEPSYWHDFLEQYGEGINHFSVRVEDYEEAMKEFEAEGVPVLQHGIWAGDAEGNGAGAYAYVDLRKDMGIVIELLQYGLKK